MQIGGQLDGSWKQALYAGMPGILAAAAGLLQVHAPLQFEPASGSTTYTMTMLASQLVAEVLIAQLQASKMMGLKYLTLTAMCELQSQPEIRRLLIL